eukprot:scaffold8150_cov116-Isochrysis_galbana.AAC.10
MIVASLRAPDGPAFPAPPNINIGLLCLLLLCRRKSHRVTPPPHPTTHHTYSGPPSREQLTILANAPSY